MNRQLIDSANFIASKMRLSKTDEMKLQGFLDKELKKLLKLGAVKDVTAQAIWNKQPPADTEVEAAYLGKAILFPSEVIPLSGEIEQDWFYNPKHQAIFYAIKRLWNEQKEVSTESILSVLKATKNLEKAGGKRYVEALAQDATFYGAEDRIEELSNYYVMRSIWALTLEAANEVMDMEPANIHDFRTGIIEALSEYAGTQKKTYYDAKDLADELALLFEKQRQAIEKGDGITGKESPIVFVNNETRGWQDTDLIIMAGRPGMGKTAYALSECAHAIQNGESCAFFSLEMSAIQLVARLFCIIKQVKIENIFVIKEGKAELSSLGIKTVNSFIHDELPNYRLYIDDKPGVHWRYILDKSVYFKKKYGLDRIFADYLQLFGSTNPKITSKEHITSDNSKGMKIVAKTIGVPVFLLSQLSRSCESRIDKRPLLSDLRDSGSIEQDADIVIFFYRDEYYKILQTNEGDSTEGVAEIIIAKHRNGSLSTIKAFFNAPYTKWDNLNALPMNYSSGNYRQDDVEDVIDNISIDDFPF